MSMAQITPAFGYLPLTGAKRAVRTGEMPPGYLFRLDFRHDLCGRWRFLSRFSGGAAMIALSRICRQPGL